MHGLGNDYIYVYGEVPDHAGELSRKLSDRHFGVGADGMIYICRSDCADFMMRIFNADGSEATMCGNGIRCVGKYVYEKGYTDRTELRIETLSGIRQLTLVTSGSRVRSVSVDMGSARVSDDLTLSLTDTGIRCTPVSVGNPHAVIFVKDADLVPLADLGPQVEKHPAFEGGVNAEFVQILSDRSMRMRVWERGSGITKACGTGACASAAAAVEKGLCEAGVPISVILDGGTLEITVEMDGHVVMNGPAETVYEGETV